MSASAETPVAGSLCIRPGLLAYENSMATSPRFYRKSWIVASTVSLIAVLIIGWAAYSSPPFFIQFGKHYVGGPDLLSWNGVYRCAPSEDAQQCDLVRESLVAAVASDTNLHNWWPIRAEFVLFE